MSSEELVIDNGQWETVKLGDFTKIQTGKLNANVSSEDGEFPFFTCSRNPLKIDTYSYNCECVLVAGNGDLNVKYYNGKFDAYQRTYIIESKDTEMLFVKYMFCFLDKYVEKLREQSIGGVIKYIKLENLTEAIIPLPPIEVQKKITNILDKASQLIEKRKTQIAKLDELTKSIFIDMFGDPMTTPKYKKMKLGQIAELERGKFTPRPRNDPRYFGGDYPFIQTGDISNSDHRLSNHTQTLNEKGIKVSKLFTKGKIVIAIVGATIGATSILEMDVYAPDSVIGITTIDNVTNTIYLEIALRFMKKVLLDIAPEAARANINLSILSNLLMICPPIELQNQFAEIAEKIEQQKALLNQGLDKFELNYKSLMQKLFN